MSELDVVRARMSMLNRKIAELRAERELLRVAHERDVAGYMERDDEDGYTFSASPEEAAETFYERECDNGHEFGENEEIVVVEYYRPLAHPSGYQADSIVEGLLENLDEDYGGEDPSDATEEMTELTKAFVADIIDRYHVWRCEPTGRTFSFSAGIFTPDVSEKSDQI